MVRLAAPAERVFPSLAPAVVQRPLVTGSGPDLEQRLPMNGRDSLGMNAGGAELSPEPGSASPGAGLGTARLGDCPGSLGEG